MANLARDLLKKIVLILVFILSFPFSLLYWPVKAAFSKRNTPAAADPLPTEETAELPAPVVGVGVVVGTGEVAQGELAVTPTVAVASQSPNSPVIRLNRRGGAAAQQAAQVQAVDHRP